ncbi:MAG TPA: NAD(P)H-quinone oxidoreductase [Motilibacterales bacterium]|nr:NAD(P)H-quinone oxidoreductase [Motilibacterales bacterium]
MRVIAIDRPGGPEVLVMATLPDPEPGPGEVLIEVAAAGVNRADLLQRQGAYPPPPGAPDTLGLECAGVIAAVGNAVTGWQVGDRVAALLDGGGYADLAIAPATQLLPVPDHLDLVDAAALPEAMCTAWSNLVMVGRLARGETVLVHGGSGGVGTIAIQLAAAMSARVAATAGGPERVARCQSLGAGIGIDHLAHDPVDVIAGATAGRGADLILDVLGAGSLAANLRALATGGRLVIIGLQQGRRGEVDLGLLLAKRATIHGTTLRSRPLAEKAAIVAEVRENAWPLLGAGDPARIRPIVHARLPLADAGHAHELLTSGAVFGKLVLVP